MQSLLYLGVGIGAGSEVAVGHFLFLNNYNVVYTDLLQDTANGLVACAVKRSINDLQSALCAKLGVD